MSELRARKEQAEARAMVAVQEDGVVGGGGRKGGERGKGKEGGKDKSTSIGMEIG